MSLTFTVLELATNSPGTVEVLAQTTDVNTTGVRSWIGDNIVFTILALIACVVLMGGLRGNLSKVFTVGGLSLVGLAFLGIAQSETAATGIGNWILGLFGIRV
jgi:membrane-bound ClpP family serine protease